MQGKVEMKEKQGNNNKGFIHASLGQIQNTETQTKTGQNIELSL